MLAQSKPLWGFVMSASAKFPVVHVSTLESYLEQLLQPARFEDYCPNGRQVAGRESIGKIVTGVTASLEFLQAAIKAEADAVLVHHGWFWKGENPCVIGPKRARLALTLAHELNIFAYHLPLDAHPTLGNNAQLAECLGLVRDADFGAQLLGMVGQAPGQATVGELARHCEHILGRAVLLIGKPEAPIVKVAWCTGAAQQYFQSAVVTGANVFITGEISEPYVHLARETGVAFLAVGHHASERYGIRALGLHVASQFGIQTEFIDIDSPV